MPSASRTSVRLPLGGRSRCRLSVTWALTAAAIEAGAMAFRVGVVPEDPTTLMGLLEDQLIRADAVVICGGGATSGALAEALGRLGTVTVDTVAMHPGALQGFGSIG